MTWQSPIADAILRLLSPIKTGAPAAILFVLAATGEQTRRITTKADKIYFPCMKSNFKTLMINVMTFISHERLILAVHTRVLMER